MSEFVPKYFRVTDTDECAEFVPTFFFSGKWLGVAAALDAEDAKRLAARGCAEVTKEAYEAAVKKKETGSDSLDRFRVVPDSTRPGLLLGNAPLAQNAKPQAPTPIQETKVSDVLKPSKVRKA